MGIVGWIAIFDSGVDNGSVLVMVALSVLSELVPLGDIFPL